MQKRALLLIDHGSRRAEANTVLEELAALVATRVGEAAIVAIAHLEIASPSIAEGFTACVNAGAEHVVAIPCLLAPGRHASEDLPARMAEAGALHPNVRWDIADALGVHPLLAELVLVRAAQWMR